MLQEYAKGHKELADILISREVIFTEDVEKIFGKRQWTSRTDEILAAKEAEVNDISETEEKCDNSTESNLNNEQTNEADNSPKNDYPANMPPLPKQ